MPAKIQIIAQRLLCCVAAAAVFAGPAGATPSVVIDVPTGQILQQEEAAAPWYPASTTKLMTAYVALDAVRRGRLTLDTPLVVSARAARMAPSKMGFRPGTEVTLYNALVMLMVKSANDIAVTIAEGVSGSVEAFADEMNRASAQLGMHESHWVNPNGLPDSRHVSSARDLAVLGRALYLQFPEYSGFFNIGAMQLGRKVMPTHNGMLGRYPGADGMKTGFTCPAGFNLVASATRGSTKLIAVVLGAPSAAARTAKTAALLDRAFQSGSPQGFIAALPSPGVAAAPDMRDSVCRHRGKATEAFLAEVEDTSIPIGSGTGIPLLDFARRRGQTMVSSREIARLPRPYFEPVQVHIGREAGYVGPVARARAPGAAVGEGGDVAAFANPGGEEGASPIGAPARDAKPLRGKKGKAAKLAAKPPAAEPAEADAAPEAPQPPARPKAADKAHGKKRDGRPDKTGANHAEGKDHEGKTVADAHEGGKHGKTDGKSDGKHPKAKKHPHE